MRFTAMSAPRTAPLLFSTLRGQAQAPIRELILWGLTILGRFTDSTSTQLTYIMASRVVKTVPLPLTIFQVQVRAPAQARPPKISTLRAQSGGRTSTEAT